jgi:GAF domain-containing protein
MLESGEERVWLEELRGHLDREQAQHYVLAVPVTVRHELVSFVLYGPHRNGSQLDPEEVELLEELAREASRAYDHIEAVRMRERYAAINALPAPT